MGLPTEQSLCRVKRGIGMTIERRHDMLAYIKTSDGARSRVKEGPHAWHVEQIQQALLNGLAQEPLYLVEVDEMGNERGEEEYILKNGDIERIG